MNLKKLKTEFHTQLKPFYREEEIDSFLNWVLQEYLEISRLEVVLQPEREITEATVEKFNKAIVRLQNFEPIQYIIGSTEFYGMTFLVNENVLIPRPETEELVEWIIQDFKGKNPENIIDVCTGSGCIAISLSSSFQESRVEAIDISAAALEVARSNAELNKVAIDFIEKDILSAEKLDKKFQVIVSNPPYVRELEKAKMQKNVLDHEPGLALFVTDENPLLFYAKLADLAIQNLIPKGSLYVELNEYLAEDVKQLFQEKGLKNVNLKKDMFGKWRFCKATK